MFMEVNWYVLEIWDQLMIKKIVIIDDYTVKYIYFPFLQLVTITILLESRK